MNTMNLEELKVTELKDLCRKANIKGYSKMRKAELVDALNNNKELKKIVVNEARNAAKDQLGHDFSKAVSFWKQLRDLKYMSASDYVDMTRAWAVLKGLLVSMDKEGTENYALTDSLAGTAESLKDIFCPDANISRYSDEELRDFIEFYITEFSLSVFSKRLKKENSSIIKMSMEDIIYDKECMAYFDSSKAHKFTGEEVKVLKDKNGNALKSQMRIVETSEDGISRMLSAKGLSSITVFMGKDSQDEEEQKLILAAKKKIFRGGIYDVATGKRFIFAFQNPSSCRKANYMFVEAKDWNQVVSFWLEITGLESWDAFKKAFFDAEGKVVMAKLLARISTRGSNSFDLSKIAPSYDKAIKEARILYIPDAKCEIVRPFKTMKGPGCMEMQENVARETKPGDGQIISSMKFHALMAVSMQIISGNEYVEFCELWDKVGKNIYNVKEGTRLHTLIQKIPGVFQLRQVADKGISVRFNYENTTVSVSKELAKKLNELNKEQFTENQKIFLGDYDLIIPESVRKFIGGDWSDHPLEICNYLKKKDKWVALNPQFIDSLNFESPRALCPIVDYWFKYMIDSLDDIAKAQQFHGIIRHSDDEESRTVASNLVAALKASSDLRNDTQICKWREKQYEKLISDMKIGRIMVPGMYSYMVCDPAFIINNVFNAELPCLAAKEYYHNNESTECALFRAPLIHPFEAQKVQLVKNDAYWYMQNVIIFNGYDGIWERMGGGDFDGDTCAIVLANTEFGRIIVNAIESFSYDIWEEAQTAKKTVFNMDNFIDYLATSAKVDRTGIITNYATKCLGIRRHLKSVVWHAKEAGCDTVTLIHPQSFGENNAEYGVFGSKYKPRAAMVDGKVSFCMKGFVEAKYNKKKQCVEFAAEGYVGTFSLDRILEISDSFLDLVAILRILQGREIDGAKTGVYAEGVSGNDFIDAVKVKFTPHQMIVRQEVLDREVAESARINEYWSLSPLAIVHDYVVERAKEINEFFKKSETKQSLLKALLTAEEKIYFNTTVEGKLLVDYLADRKTAYNAAVRTIMDNCTGEEKTEALANVKDYEISVLRELSSTNGIPTEVIAVASYVAAYNKDSKQKEGLTYGWLFLDELLLVFSRNNKKFELYKLPEYVEKACIINNVLYVNEQKYRFNMNAADCENVVIQKINGTPYALIHKPSTIVVKPSINNNVVYGATTYTIGVVGFKYHIVAENPKEEWKKIVKENNYIFDIVFDESGNVRTVVNGKVISSLTRTTINDDLIGKKVRINSNDFKESDASIADLKVIIIGEADCQ